MELPSLEQLNQEFARRSFREYVRQAWPLLEPETKLIPNWHLDAICDHLQAVHEGKTKNLIINIPYRLGKSILVSVLFPTWTWLSDPAHKYLCTSHTHRLVIINAQKARQIVTSDWYKAFFPNGDFSLVKDTENASINNYQGVRYSYSVGSKVTGVTANTLIIDDPMTSESASSTLEREAVTRSIENDFMTRLTPPGKGRVIIVMQRLHNEDTSGRYLKNPKWDRLIIPAVFEGDHRSKTALGWVDPRIEPGESIFEEYFSTDYIEQVRLQNGNHFYASQLQQHPVSAAGAIIHYEWIKTYTELPEVKKWSISCDTAIKTGQNNDYSVIQLWAECENGYYLVDMVHKKLEYPDLKKVLTAFCDSNPAHEIIIEDKSSGSQLVQDFKRSSRIPVIPVIPGRDMPLKKDERLQLTSGLFESGKIYINEEAYWKLDFMKEVCEFGYTKHDDMVDAMTQYLARALSRRSKSNVRIL
jgi:predicted phage terminase large subunit-like protein